MVAVAWNKIKAEYLQGVTPKELALKYKLTAKQISDKANRAKWVDEKTKINESLRENMQDKIEALTNKALKTLENVLDDENADHNVKVQASKALIDISGLKQQRIDGLNGINNIIINREIVDENSNI